MRLAYADRDQYLGDPRFRPRAGRRADRPGLSRAALGADLARPRRWRSVDAGTPAGAPTVAARRLRQPERGTSHFVAVDRWGNVASETSTIESGFGSGLMVNGYYLNNELTDFSFVPEKDGCPVANRVEGGKRPRSSMSADHRLRPGRHGPARGRRGGRRDDHRPGRQGDHRRDRLASAARRQAIALPMIFAPGDTVYVEKRHLPRSDDPAAPGARPRRSSRCAPGFKANAIEWVDGRWVGARRSAQRRRGGLANEGGTWLGSSNISTISSRCS